MYTRDDLAKLKDILYKSDVIELFSREKLSSKSGFYKLTNFTVIAARLKDVPMGCKEAVLLETLIMWNGTIYCLTFEENTSQTYNDNLCHFRAFALHLHGTQRLHEETSKLFNLFINMMDWLSANQFQGVHLIDNPVVEDLVTLNILL